MISALVVPRRNTRNAADDRRERPMKRQSTICVGDVVVSKSDRFFHSGAKRYSHAIIGSLVPFVLVSEQGDMVWSCTWKPEEVEVVRHATNDIKAVVAARLANEAPCGRAIIYPLNDTCKNYIELHGLEENIARLRFTDAWWEVHWLNYDMSKEEILRCDNTIHTNIYVASSRIEKEIKRVLPKLISEFIGQ
jgi:hypothetical protein